MRTRNLIITALVIAVLVIGLAVSAFATTGGERGERERDRDRDRDRVAEQVEAGDIEEVVARDRDRDRLHERDGDGPQARMHERDREHACDGDGAMTREYHEACERDRLRAPTEEGDRAGEGTGRQHHERGCETHPVRQCPNTSD